MPLNSTERSRRSTAEAAERQRKAASRTKLKESIAAGNRTLRENDISPAKTKEELKAKMSRLRRPNVAAMARLDDSTDSDDDEFNEPPPVDSPAQPGSPQFLARARIMSPEERGALQEKIFSGVLTLVADTQARVDNSTANEQDRIAAEARAAMELNNTAVVAVAKINSAVAGQAIKSIQESAEKAKKNHTTTGRDGMSLFVASLAGTSGQQLHRCFFCHNTTHV